MKHFYLLYTSFTKRIFLFIFYFGLLIVCNINAQDNRVSTRSGQKIFSSGMNMAWASNFASNAVNLREQDFIDALDDISEAGGNTMRW